MGETENKKVDLIDRNSLIELFANWKSGLGDSPAEDAVSVILTAVIDKIKAQTVAYELDGVLEKMEELRECAESDRCLDSGQCSYRGANTCQEHYILNAIEIVKAGVR